MTVGKWRPSASADEPHVKQASPAASTTAGGRSREVSFVQKIDNPLSPIRQGRGFWFQRVGWLASGVLVYQTLSTIKDVPFGDSWAIRKKWSVRPAGTCARARARTSRAATPAPLPAAHAPRRCTCARWPQARRGSTRRCAR